jgi:transcriptional regulator with XRE-family HTH domain
MLTTVGAVGAHIASYRAEPGQPYLQIAAGGGHRGPSSLAISHNQMEGISWPAAEISVPTTLGSRPESAAAVGHTKRLASFQATLAPEIAPDNADKLDPGELRARRRALGLSQAGLAQALGVAPNTVARWERGELRSADPSRVRTTLTRLEADAVATHGPDLCGRPRRRHKLPAHLSRLIGRDEAGAELYDSLAQAEAGLLTLTGPGGCGKTRLALQVARALTEAFPDGVWLVDLAPLGDPSLVAHTLATVLGLRLAEQRHSATSPVAPSHWRASPRRSYGARPMG